MDNFQTVPVGSWSFRVGEDDHFPKGEANGLEQLINTEWLRSRRAQKLAHSWAGLEEWKIPSPVIRVDMGTWDASSYGLWRRVMEVEERPGGLGALLTLCPDTQPFLEEALSDCDGFVHLGGPIQDDIIAATILQKPFYDGWYGPRSGMYWVRHDTLGRSIQYPPELLLELERHSLVPIRADGCKEILVHLGWAESLESYLAARGDFPWETGFCVKPKMGTWTSGVHIHHPHWSDKSSTSKKIRAETKGKEGEFLLQPLIPPRTVRRGKNGSSRVYFEIQRVFLCYDRSAKRYRVAGGIAMGTPSLKVHGTSECYVRRIVVEK